MACGEEGHGRRFACTEEDEIYRNQKISLVSEVMRGLQLTSYANADVAALGSGLLESILKKKQDELARDGLPVASPRDCFNCHREEILAAVRQSLLESLAPDAAQMAAELPRSSSFPPLTPAPPRTNPALARTRSSVVNSEEIFEQIFKEDCDKLHLLFPQIEPSVVSTTLRQIMLSDVQRKTYFDPSDNSHLQEAVSVLQQFAQELENLPAPTQSTRVLDPPEAAKSPPTEPTRSHRGWGYLHWPSSSARNPKADEHLRIQREELEALRVDNKRLSAEEVRLESEVADLERRIKETVLASNEPTLLTYYEKLRENDKLDDQISRLEAILGSDK